VHVARGSQVRAAYVRVAGPVRAHLAPRAWKNLNKGGEGGETRLIGTSLSLLWDTRARGRAGASSPAPSLLWNPRAGQTLHTALTRQTKGQVDVDKLTAAVAALFRSSWSGAAMVEEDLEEPHEASLPPRAFHLQAFLQVRDFAATGFPRPAT
jgi:hypothetical protein